MLRIDIRARFGALQGNLAVPPGELRLAEFAWNFLPLGDRLVGMAAQAAAKANRPVSCAKGCGACCRQAVPLSPAEAWMLADQVATYPAERRETILGRFAQARARLLGEEPTTVPLTLALDWAAAHREEGRQRFDAQVLMRTFFEILAAAMEKAP